MTDTSEQLQHDQLLSDLIDAIRDEISEAEVDYPAGREAGPCITFDEKSMRSALERVIERGPDAERIVAAALSIDELVMSLPPPARHHDLIRLYFKNYCLQVGPSHQGFLTSTGRFVDREQAARIAVLAGQIESPKWGLELYSEDLW